MFISFWTGNCSLLKQSSCRYKTTLKINQSHFPFKLMYPLPLISVLFSVKRKALMLLHPIKCAPNKFNFPTLPHPTWPQTQAFLKFEFQVPHPMSFQILILLHSPIDKPNPFKNLPTTPYSCKHLHHEIITSQSTNLLPLTRFPKHYYTKAFTLN